MGLKRTKNKLVIEAIVVILVITTLCWVMIPRFMSNQTMVRINHNENELIRLLNDVQNRVFKVKGFIFQDAALKTPEQSSSWFLSSESIQEQYPEYSFDFIENDTIEILFLGLDHFDDVDNRKYPLVFITSLIIKA